MKYLFGAVLLLFVAAGAALVAVRNPGYVLITREPFVLETSLAIFLLLLAALFAILYVALRLVSRILHAPRNLSRWRQARRTRKARESFHQGLTQLIEGEWPQAEKSLLASLHAADTPYLNQLAAALAAHAQHEPEKRDQYLVRAHQQAPANSHVVDLLQARLQLESAELEPAHATLARLRTEQPAPPEALRLLIQVYRRLHDWQGLAHLLPEARRRKLLSDADLKTVEIETHRELLGLNLPANALSTLQQAWSEVPRALRTEPQLVAAYARQLLRQGASEDCVKLLAGVLDQHWDEQLVLLYGEARGHQPADQLETAQDWLARHGESPTLLLTLGRLARACNDPDRARGYLEKSLTLAASTAAHRELGALFEARGESARAVEQYRLALTHCQETHDPTVGAARRGTRTAAE